MENENLCHLKIRSIYLMICCFFLLLVFQAQVCAESLPDPTRPYNVVEPVITDANPVLQSVLISDSRQVAIINGKRVAVGDRYADSQLIHLEDGEAILQGKHGSQKLSLFPASKNNEIKRTIKPQNSPLIVPNEQVAKW